MFLNAFYSNSFRSFLSSHAQEDQDETEVEFFDDDEAEETVATVGRESPLSRRFDPMNRRLMSGWTS